MIVRSRTQDDLDGCVKALAEVQAADGYPVDWPDDPAGFLTPSDLAGAWVAVDDEGVAGHVGVTVGDAVTRLFVAPRARGRGLAVRLLEALTVRPLTLEVSDEGRRRSPSMRGPVGGGWGVTGQDG